MTQYAGDGIISIAIPPQRPPYAPIRQRHLYANYYQLCQECNAMFFFRCVVLKKTVYLDERASEVYFELVYFVTAFVPSLTACLASSPGKRRRTAV